MTDLEVQLFKALTKASERILEIENFCKGKFKLEQEIEEALGFYTSTYYEQEGNK